VLTVFCNPVQLIFLTLLTQMTFCVVDTVDTVITFVEWTLLTRPTHHGLYARHAHCAFDSVTHTHCLLICSISGSKKPFHASACSGTPSTKSTVALCAAIRTSHTVARLSGYKLLRWVEARRVCFYYFMILWRVCHTISSP